MDGILGSINTTIVYLLAAVMVQQAVELAKRAYPEITKRPALLQAGSWLLSVGVVAAIELVYPESGPVLADLAGGNVAHPNLAVALDAFVVGTLANTLYEWTGG